MVGHPSVPPLTTLGKRSKAHAKAFTKVWPDPVLLAKDSPSWPPLAPIQQPKYKQIKTLLISWPGPPHPGHVVAR